MRVELEVIANAQGGLVTRRQMTDAGVREPELRGLTRAYGPYVAVRRGIYVSRTRWDVAAETRDGQAKLRDRAAHLAMVQPHLMSHDSAARALGIPLLDPKVELVHVTREGVGGSRTDHGVKHHLTRLGLLRTVTMEGMPVTGPARTAADIAREHGLPAGLVAADAARRSGLSTADLEAELLGMKCWRGVVAAREAARLSDAGAESPGESLLRLALLELGLGAVHTQFPVARARGVAWVDLRVGRHLFEFDGRVKYRREESGGVARGAIEDVVWNERQRERELLESGFGISRVTWDELFGVRRRALLERLRRECETTRQRYGDVLPESARQFAAAMTLKREARARG